MEELDAVELEAPFSFTLPQPEKLGIPVLQIKEVRALTNRRSCTAIDQKFLAHE